MLTLNRRNCLLGLKSSTDGKEVDGTEVKLLTLELEDIPLEKRELCALLGEPHAWNVLYNNVRPPEPYLKCLKSLELRAAVEGAAVTLVFGVDESSVAMTKVKLSKLKLELKSGGVTNLSCKVTAAPALDATFAQLLEHLGKGIEVEMRFEPDGQQQDLPLNRFSAESPPMQPDDGDEEDAENATGKAKRKPPKPRARKPANGHPTH